MRFLALRARNDNGTIDVFVVIPNEVRNLVLLFDFIFINSFFLCNNTIIFPKSLLPRNLLCYSIDSQLVVQRNSFFLRNI